LPFAVKADISFGRPLLSPVEVCVSVLFFGLAPLAQVPALVSTSALSAPWASSPPLLLALMAFAVAACALSAPWAFSLPLLLGRALSAEALSRMVRLIAAEQLLVFRVSPTMGAKRRRQYRMRFAQPRRRSLALQGAGAERSDCCHPSNVSLSN